MGKSSQTSERVPADVDRVVRKVLAGETVAFEELIRMYESEVWRIAAVLMRDWNATEGVVQQAFIDAYTHLHQYQLGTDFAAWLRTIARNRVRKELRAASRAEHRLAEYRAQVVERVLSDEPRRDDTDAYLAALRSCRSELPSNEASLLKFRYEMGLTFDAIASRCGLTPAAVQRAISRTRFRLRACIEGQLNPS